MPAISFQKKWLDKLLSGTKQQTTRAQTSRIKVGDICSIYNQQRRSITAKPVRQMTSIGSRTHTVKLMDGKYPNPPEMIPNDLMFQPVYYAHFLGKVEITEVYDIQPNKMSEEDLKAWALDDGFRSFHPLGVFSEQSPSRKPGANEWFISRYGYGWMQRTWTVIRWNGWLERYFEPEG